jgi:hypothetical protein
MNDEDAHGGSPFDPGAQTLPWIGERAPACTIDGATSSTTAANNTFNAAKAEPLREPIRSALSTWAGC